MKQEIKLQSNTILFGIYRAAESQLLDDDGKKRSQLL